MRTIRQEEDGFQILKEFAWLLKVVQQNGAECVPVVFVQELL